MLHSLKRNFALAHQPLTSAPNAEYADLRQRLSSIKASLKYACAMLRSADRHWIVQMQEQRRFSERFRESYPTPSDELARVAGDFAAASQRLYDQFTRGEGNEGKAYEGIHQQMQVYLREIEGVEARYGRLAEAKSEAGRYQAKLDAMERSKKGPEEAKKERNLRKMDTQKDLYVKLLKEVVEAQKCAYAKHPVVFKAALTAYWLSHEKHVTLLVQSLEETQEFAKGAEQEMRELDIANWTPAAVENGEEGLLDASQRSGGAQVKNGVEVEEVEIKAEENEQEEEFHSASVVPIDTKDAEVGSPITSPTHVGDKPTSKVTVNKIDPLQKALTSNSKDRREVAA